MESAEAVVFEVVGGSTALHLWRPAGLAADPARPAPGLLLFSHGQGGLAAEAAPLGRHLAARGWILAAPQHRDREAAERGRQGDRRASPQTFAAGRWQHRLEDLRAALGDLLGGGVAGAAIDPHRVAVAGFSLGGWAALALAGALPGWRDERLGGAVLLSPAVFMWSREQLGWVAVPTLYLYGAREGRERRQGLSKARWAATVHAALPRPTYLVEVPASGHRDLVGRRPALWAQVWAALGGRQPGPGRRRAACLCAVASAVEAFVRRHLPSGVQDAKGPPV
jgi:dienelactone hydrolase